jgi:hypothetical protein
MSFHRRDVIIVTRLRPSDIDTTMENPALASSLHRHYLTR